MYTKHVWKSRDCYYSFDQDFVFKNSHIWCCFSHWVHRPTMLLSTRSAFRFSFLSRWTHLLTTKHVWKSRNCYGSCGQDFVFKNSHIWCRNFSHWVHEPTMVLSTRSTFRFSFLPRWMHLTTMPKRARNVFSFVLPRNNWNPYVQLWLTHCGHNRLRNTDNGLSSWICVNVLAAHKKQKTFVDRENELRNLVQSEVYYNEIEIR